MGQLKMIIKAMIQCDFRAFIKYNYCSNNVLRKKDCYLWPYKGSIIKIHPSAKLVLDGTLQLNANKLKGSKAESYFILDQGAEFSIEDDSRINYGSTVHLNCNSVLKAGSFTTNTGINFQVKKSIIIGLDCMFGRNVTIFDTAFHPTGMIKASMLTNAEEVVIGNHVWVGANSFIVQGSKIGDGSMLGSGVYFRGVVGEAISVLRQSDVPKFVGNMWARSEKPEDINSAVMFYKSQDSVPLNEEAVNSYKKEIISILQSVMLGIDFVNEDSLLTNHIIDSLALIEIVKIIEDRFHLLIPYYEISAVNFDSVDTIASLIGKLKKENLKGMDSNDMKMKYLPTNDNYVVKSQNTLIGYVKEHAKKNPDKIAVFSGEREYTYSALYKYAQRYGSFLLDKGVNRGERLVVKSSQSIEYIIIYLGIHYSGGVISTVEGSAHNNRILEVAKEIEAKYIISDQNPDTEDKYIFIESTRVFENMEGVEIKENQFPDGEDSADILFTTGTTGQSKGVELSHSAIIAGAENIAFGCEMRRDTVLVVPNPLSHSNAIKNMGACFITGSSFYVLDGITDLSAYFRALNCTYGKVATVLPPAAIRILFQLAKDQLASYVDKLDYLMAATAPLPEPDRQTLRQLLPKTRLYNHYGCSESSSICIYDFNKYSQLRNCVGRPMPHSRVFFVDENKKEISSSPNNIGLLAVEGDAAMKGYYRDPELTAKIKDGRVIYTKDMGYISEQGFVYILGRKDDIINVGGLKVSPLEVEAAALSFEGVIDCICIGVNDEMMGQALKLLVVLGKSFDIEAFKRELSERLEGYKVPKQIEVVEKIERTYNGKLNRKAYR